MLNYHQLGNGLAEALQANRQAKGWLPSAADDWPAPEELDLERHRWSPEVLRAGIRRPLILVGGFAANGLSRVEEYGGRRYLGQQVWPPFHFHPTSGNWRIHALSELNRGELVPTSLLIGQYEPLLLFLQQELGYRLDHDLFLFPYCWTESNRTSGRRLAGFIRQVLERRGDEEVDILSHSMGGLVARVAGLLYGAPLRRCIYLACPFFGAGKAYFNLHPGQTLQLVDNLLLNRLISRFSPETLLNREQTLRQCFQSWPSLFELLPDGHAFSQGWAPVGRRSFPDGQRLQANQWEAAYCEDASTAFPAELQKAVAEAMALKDELGLRMPGTRYLTLYSAAFPTPSRVDITLEMSLFTVFGQVYDLDNAGGDGTVPSFSGKGPGEALEVHGRHLAVPNHRLTFYWLARFLDSCP